MIATSILFNQAVAEEFIAIGDMWTVFNANKPTAAARSRARYVVNAIRSRDQVLMSGFFATPNAVVIRSLPTGVSLAL